MVFGRNSGLLCHTPGFGRISRCLHLLLLLSLFGRPALSFYSLLLCFRYDGWVCCDLPGFATALSRSRLVLGIVGVVVGWRILVGRVLWGFGRAGWSPAFSLLFWWVWSLGSESAFVRVQGKVQLPLRGRWGPNWDRLFSGSQSGSGSAIAGRGIDNCDLPRLVYRVPQQRTCMGARGTTTLCNSS